MDANTADLNATRIVDTLSDITETRALPDTVAEMILKHTAVPQSVIDLFHITLFGNPMGRWLSAFIVFMLFFCCESSSQKS